MRAVWWFPRNEMLWVLKRASRGEVSLKHPELVFWWEIMKVFVYYFNEIYAVYRVGTRGGGNSLYDIVQMWVRIAPFFSTARYMVNPLFKKEDIWMARFSDFWHLNCPNFWHPCICIYLSLDSRQAFVFIFTAVFFLMMRVICKLVYKSQRIWKGKLIQRTVYG